jgi:hypothetical protein
MEPGTQIAYVPTHARDDLDHPDVEFGFVVSVIAHKGFAFCRYWRKGEPGVLRTVANSEGTPLDRIHVIDSVDQKIVDDLLEAL